MNFKTPTPETVPEGAPVPYVVATPEVMRHLAIGEHFTAKWKSRLAEKRGDVAHVALQMKKQGIPVDVARLLLAP